MDEQIMPPLNLVRVDAAWKNLDHGRSGCLPVAEPFNQAQIENRIIQGLAGDGVPAVLDGVEVDFGRKGDIGGNGKMKSSGDLRGSLVDFKTLVTENRIFVPQFVGARHEYRS